MAHVGSLSRGTQAATARRPRLVFAGLGARLDAERDRWFLWVPVLYGAGIGLYFSLFVEPALALAIAPAVMFTTLWLVFRRGTMAVVALAALLSMALGFAAAKVRSDWVHSPIIERQISLADVRGWVELVEPRPTRGERLTIRVATIRGLRPDQVPYRVRIRTPSATTGLRPGDPVRLRATLSRPAAPALPGGYDFARQAYFQQLGGVGYALARAEAAPELGAPPVMLAIAARISTVRQAISQRVRAGLDGERGGIADALITGERGGISEATNQVYRDSGLFHILSISGLHMTIMAGAVFFALRLMMAAIPIIALRFPIKKIAAAGAVLAALGYLLISGGAFATVRSWVMITIMFTAVLFDRPAIALRNVAVSALLILLVMPESLLDIGFQMSFAAVVALVAAYEAWRERQDQIAATAPGRIVRSLMFFGGIVLTTLIASIAVAPFGIYHFHTGQQYAIIANLIAIPVCNLIVMPAALATLVVMPLGLEAAPLWVMGFGIDVMTWCAQRVAELPGAVTRLPAIPLVSFLLMATGGLWLCLWRTRWRVLGIGVVAVGAALSPFRAAPDVLVGHEGSVLAARLTDGKLYAIANRGGNFELARWLEHDGDHRKPREAVQPVKDLTCDAMGCVARVKGQTVTLARHHAALAEDCARARVAILTMPRPPSCVSPGAVIDLFALRDMGTHAVYLDGEQVRIVNVADARGDRPWSRVTGPRRAQPPSPTTTASASGSRLQQFSPPMGLVENEPMPRPEVEDDEDMR